MFVADAPRELTEELNSMTQESLELESGGSSSLACSS